MPSVKALMIESSKELRSLMSVGLSEIAFGMIDQIMGRMKNLTPSQYASAAKDLNTPGVRDYKDRLLTAISVVAGQGIDSARKDVPSKKNIRLSEEQSILLGEWDKLPTKLRKRVLQQTQLLIDTQMADITKALVWQHSSSAASTDSLAQLRVDLEVAAEEYAEGMSVRAAAEIISARVVNESRVAFFTETSVVEEIEAFQFVNADPVTPICNDLAGTIFAVNDPGLDRYMPPLHWGCKSYIIPILKGKLGNRSIETLKPSTKKIEEGIQFAELPDFSTCACFCCGRILTA